MRAIAVSTIIALVLCQQCVLSAEAKMKPEDYLSSKQISVRQYGKDWVIKGAHRSVELSESDLSIKIKSAANVWSMKPSQPND